MKHIEVLKLALEALEEIHPGNMTPMAEGSWNKAITAIRAVLAEQPVQQDSVAVQMFRTPGCSDWYDGVPDQHELGQHEVRTLYTSPPQRKPLTDEQWQVIADTLGCLITRSQKDVIEAELKKKKKNT